MKLILVAAFAFLLLNGCKKNAPAAATAPFSDSPVSRVVTPGFIDEASGIADSKTNPGYLWVEQDSDNPTDLFLINYDANRLIKIFLKGAQNRDWEDIAVGKGPELKATYVYLADIGDNHLAFSDYFIYRFIEPSIVTDTIYSWEKISFKYPDGPHDAEAILLDDNTGDIYIITKSDSRSKIFKLGHPQSTQNTMIATLQGELPFNGVVSAAMSPDLKEIVVKTYSTLSYWTRRPEESVETTLKRPSTSLSYQMEPKGEGVCFSNQNTGFFTISEKPAWIQSVSLNFYSRK